jgi:hypothetical protein
MKQNTHKGRCKKIRIPKPTTEYVIYKKRNTYKTYNHMCNDTQYNYDE